MELLEKIRSIVLSNAILEVSEQLGNNDNLLEAGLDSLQMIRIIVALEREFDFEFSDEDLVIGNFSTIGNIAESMETILKCNQE